MWSYFSLLSNTYFWTRKVENNLWTWLWFYWNVLTSSELLCKASSSDIPETVRTGELSMYILHSILWKLLSTRTLLEWKIFFPLHCQNLSPSENYLAIHVPSPSPKPHWVYYQVKWVADLRMWRKQLIFLSIVSTCPFFIFWFIAHSLPYCLPIGLRSIKTASLLSGLLWLDMPHFCQNAKFYLCFYPLNLWMGVEFHLLAYWEDPKCFMSKIPYLSGNRKTSQLPK